ncbi:hypothetical protein HPP92_010844 [Vanilla planifolia]|uniref:Uncharacterized protein n=1 Tax=Vanilla planifolia TaxID=51239 RepID=A0A835R7A9_VANPL|nr:hypothetical protein HPP92_010844 [Vanilla planifolia]
MQVVAFTAETSVGDFFPCLGWIDVLTGWRSKLEKRFKAMDGLLKEEIEERIRNRRGRQHIDPVNFLDALLRSEAGMDFFLDFLQDQNVIKAALMDMFLAGTEPPALTMEWAMAELMKNPKAMNKLQEEVRGVVGSKGKVEEEDLQKLPYVKSVLKETLRLHPPGPLSARTKAQKTRRSAATTSRQGRGFLSTHGPSRGILGFGKTLRLSCRRGSKEPSRLPRVSHAAHTLRRGAADVPRNVVRHGLPRASTCQRCLCLRLGPARRRSTG